MSTANIFWRIQALYMLSPRGPNVRFFEWHWSGVRFSLDPPEKFCNDSRLPIVNDLMRDKIFGLYDYAICIYMLCMYIVGMVQGLIST